MKDTSSSTATTTTIEALAKILRQDQEPVVELDIAILRSTQEGDPFILQDGHLGLHAGDLGSLAREFRRAYRTIRPDFLKAIISHSNNNDKDASTQTAGEQLLEVTSCLLLVCPDNGTAWADRKRALLELTTKSATANNNNNNNNKKNNNNNNNNNLVIISWGKELQYLNLIMTRHTKAPTCWFHRKYVFQKVSCQTESIETLLESSRAEIQVCVNVAEQYPKNYYAWTYRIHIINKLQERIMMDRSDSTTAHQAMFVHFLEEEWTSIEVWLRTHVSDHSAVHFAGSVLRLLLQYKLKAEDVGGLIATVENAMSSSRSAVEAYPTHEVLWIFRRVCSHAFLTKISTIIDQATVQETLAQFWSQEVIFLLKREEPNKIMDRHNKTTGSNEAYLEATQCHLSKLSYVAWVLECVVRLALDVAGCLGIQESELASIRSNLLVSLQGLESMPHNLYRSCKR